MQQRSKILFFLTSSYPYSNGETFIENEIKYLEKIFDKIFIVSSSSEREIIRYLPNNCTPISFKEKDLTGRMYGFRYLFTSFFFKELLFIIFNIKRKLSWIKIKIILREIQLAKCLQKKISSLIVNNKFENQDIYIYSYWNDYKALATAMLKAKKIKYKTFSRAHRWDLYHEVNTDNYLPLKNYILQKLDCIFFISQNGLDYFSTIHDSNNKFAYKLKLSRLGVWRCNECKIEIKEKHNVFNIVSCAFIYPNKRIDLIVNALALINNININWIHFGNGHTENDFNFIQNLAVKLLQDKVNIKYKFPGFVENNDISKYLNENVIDVFINTSASEGVPVSIMESLSCGIPVIATAVGGTPEIIEDNLNGFLLSQNPSPEEIAEKIIQISLLAEDEVISLRTNAYKSWNEKYNADKNYHIFIKEIINI